jgi:hypothetical protein
MSVPYVNVHGVLHIVIKGRLVRVDTTHPNYAKIRDCLGKATEETISKLIGKTTRQSPEKRRHVREEKIDALHKTVAENMEKK